MGGQTLLFVAVWESTKVQWQHMLRMPGAHDHRMEVAPRFAVALAPWLPQFALARDMRVREKNWAPFLWRGSLYVEYSLEPRLVLALNPEMVYCLD